MPTANGTYNANISCSLYICTANSGTTVLNLPFFDDCTAGSFPTGGTCNTGDQKWQEVLNDTESPLDLTNYPPGDYIIEVFFDLTGDNNSTVYCYDTIYSNIN